MENLSTYKIKDRIDDSRWATLFTAEHKVTGQIVMVKFFNLNGTLAHLTGTDEELVWRHRFALETHIMNSVDHSNVVKLLGYGALPNGRPCFIMPFIINDLTYELGPDINDPAELIRLAPPRRPKQMRPDRAFHVLRQMLRGLDAVHRLGIVHRTLKPENVMMTRRKAGNPVIGNFGLSKWGARVVEIDDELMVDHGYTSPEQIADPNAVGTSADVFSVGAIAYRMLTARMPDKHETSVCAAGAKVPAAVDRLIQTCLSTEPEKRPIHANAMRAALDRAIAE